jgi:thiamine biosynthesis lipoprotein
MAIVQWIVWIGVLLATADVAAEDLRRYEFSQVHMGVPFRVTLYAPTKAVANRAATAAFARIGKLDGILSDYNRESELMRLCRSAKPGRPVRVSEELFTVLARAAVISNRSDGAFDVSVGPLVKLWRRARRRKRLPDPDDLTAAKRAVGYGAIRMDKKKRTVELLKTGMLLDLGGIAKGYAGDEALKALRKAGVSRVLIDGGGDIVVGDPPPGKPGWRIGVAKLGAEDGLPSRYFTLKNAAVATSGDAFQAVEIGGQRYSHIVDPKTGVGLTIRSSVTVVARDGMTADVLASAVSVLGRCGGAGLMAKFPGTGVSIVVIESGIVREYAFGKRLSGGVEPPE